MCKVLYENEKNEIAVLTESLVRLTGKNVKLESKKDCQCCTKKPLKENNEVQEIKNEIAKLEKENKEGFAREITRLKTKLFALEKLNKLKEGTWSLPETEGQRALAIKSLENWKTQYYSIVGDDEVFNGIDAAIARIKVLPVDQK